jgi:hypothetical protein
MQARDPTASQSIAGSAPPSRLAAVPVHPTGAVLARLAATVGNRAFARAAAQGRLGAVRGRQVGGAGSQGRSGGQADGAGRVLARCACGRPARSGEACSDCARGSDAERDARHVLSKSAQARRLVGRKPLEEDRVLSRDAAATTGSVGRPVYVCWSPTEAVPVANHSWFRLDDPAPDPQHETFSLFPVPSGKRKSDGATCTQGQTFAGADDKGGIARQGRCKLVGISPSCIGREFFRYPIGQYCPGGPNSNTFVGTIVSNCGGGDITDSWSARDLLNGDWVPGFTDAAPASGTYGPNLAGIGAVGIATCGTEDCKGGNDTIGPFADATTGDTGDPVATATASLNTPTSDGSPGGGVGNSDSGSGAAYDGGAVDDSQETGDRAA